MHHASRIVFVALPLLALALSACEDPAKDAPKATVSSAAPTAVKTAAPAASAAPTAAATAAAAPAAGGLKIDSATSSVDFVGSKVTGTHAGKFEKFSGTVALDGDTIETAKIAIEIDMASVKSDDEKLDGHLKSPDFFDVEKFPKATFTSTEIKAGGEGGATHTITGELELHGVKKTVSFPAKITLTEAEVAATSEFSINRKDFAIVYPGMTNDLIRDDVVIKLAIKAPRK
mgnify:CR=1 FL=1